jgi:hypothetical protein
MKTPANTWPVVYAVVEERKRQEGLKAAGKFSATCADAELSDADCFSVLAEEVGEAADELLALLLTVKLGRVGHTVNEAIQRPRDPRKLHTELVQVAAVAVAWCERLSAEIAALDEQAAQDMRDLVLMGERPPADYDFEPESV